MTSNTYILTGHVLTMLEALPDESVQCCVTSPPYWGLRSYGTKAQIWGGNPTCRHAWGAEIPVSSTSGFHRRTQQTVTGGIKRFSQRAAGQGSFCECGAWRGDLGLEPTPELYTEHIVEVFRALRRVLRKDGTLWLNLGDCYATGGGKVGNCPGGGQQGAKYRGDHGPDPKSVAIGPRTQPNRMPIIGLKPKDMVGMPWRVAFALQADGWYLRSDIIWHKTNPMPESVRDRPTKSHEYLFLLSKSERYLYDAGAIKEPATGNAHDRARKERSAEGQKTLPTGERNGMRPSGVNPKAQKWPNAWPAESGRHDGVGNGRFRPKQNASFSEAVVRTVEFRNKRTIWTLPTKPYTGAHFATFPPKLIEPCILAGSRPGDRVIDPFMGAGTTAMVALEHNRDFVGIELSPAYVKLAGDRLKLPWTFKPWAAKLKTLTA
jgi:DNA modification methylase